MHMYEAAPIPDTTVVGLGSSHLHSALPNPRAGRRNEVCWAAYRACTRHTDPFEPVWAPCPFCLLLHMLGSQLLLQVCKGCREALWQCCQTQDLMEDFAAHLPRRAAYLAGVEGSHGPVLAAL